MNDARAANPPIRLTILCGFLGAGKTTLLNRLLKHPDLSDTAVVVNEFGEAGIDPLLVETTFSDGVVELSNGCVCCSVRGELVDTLLDLAHPAKDGRRRPRRVILETTGLADPSPVLVSMMTHPQLLSDYALDGVVTVIDTLSGANNLASRREARRQIAVADRIVVTKTDLADAGAAERLREAIAAHNPRATVVDASEPGTLADRLTSCGIVDPATGAADPERWLGIDSTAREHDPHGHEQDHSHGREAGEAHGHGDIHNHGHAHDHETVRSFSIVRHEPVAWDAVVEFLDLLGHTHGPAILRMKAIVWSTESEDRPIVLHGVAGYLHPPQRLPAWPAGMARQTRIVLIGDALPEAACRDLFAAFSGEARVDAPDRAAIEANPLAVPGHRFR